MFSISAVLDARIDDMAEKMAKKYQLAIQTKEDGKPLVKVISSHCVHEAMFPAFINSLSLSFSVCLSVYVSVCLSPTCEWLTKVNNCAFISVAYCAFISVAYCAGTTEARAFSHVGLQAQEDVLVAGRICVDAAVMVSWICFTSISDCIVIRPDHVDHFNVRIEITLTPYHSVSNCEGCETQRKRCSS